MAKGKKSRDSRAPADGLDLPGTRVAVWSVFFLLALLLAAHIYAAYYPSRWVWGILHGLSFASEWRWLIWGVGLVLIFPPVAGACARVLTKYQMPRVLTRYANPLVRGVLISIILFILFIVFRSRAYIFGDGYRMLNRLGNADPAIIFSSDVHKEILDLAWHWINHRLWAEPFGLSPEITYAVLNSLAGVLLFFGLARLIQTLATKREDRFLLWSAILSSGTLLFAFGYVESYVWALAGSVWALGYAVRSFDKPKLWRTALVLLAISIAFHWLALIFAPAIIWARWRYVPAWIKELPHGSFLTVFLAVGIVATAGALFASRFLGSPLSVFPPAGQSSPYLLWSLSHLSDAINLFLLVAPALLPLLLAGGKGEKRHTLFFQGTWAVVLLAASFAWWASFLIDPTLGAMRDWDLLSFVGPFSVLAAAGFFLARHSEIPRRTVAVISVQLLGLAAFHQVPWVGFHRDGNRVINIMDQVLVDDPHLSTSYFEATRAVDFASALIKENVGRYDLAAKYYLRRLEVAPDDATSWWNLGSISWYRGDMDSCYTSYRKSLRLDSAKAGRWFAFGIVLYEQGQYDEAKKCLQQAIDLRPDPDDEWKAQWGLAEIYTHEGMFDSAAASYLQVTLLQPKMWEAHYNAGAALIRAGDDETALRQLISAVKLNPRNSGIYRRAIEIYLFRKNVSGVHTVLNGWRQSVPQESEITRWDSLLAPLPEHDVPDTAVAIVMAGMATWYTSQDMAEIAASFFERAARLDTTNIDYRLSAEKLRQSGETQP